MSEFGKYPSPDFGCPGAEASTQTNGASLIRPSTFQNQNAASSSFQPSMWNWYEPPSNPWVCNYQAHDPNWYGGGGSSFSHRGHGSNRQNGNFCRGGGWHRGGREQYGARNNQGNHGKTQKQRKEPEYSHFCDTCDRGFKNQYKFEEHMSQHVECSVPDCSFTAHEKIVSIHWRNNHAPGAKRIKLDTPDEIEKWREDRRKNYPTLHNVEKKSKMMATREERGEVLETAQFGRMHRGRGRRGHRGRRFQRGRGSGRDAPHHQQLHHQARDQPEKPSPTPKPRWEGDPLGALAKSDPDSDADRDEPAWGEGKQGSLTVAPKQMTPGLGALIASYGSMTDSDSDDQPEAVPIQRGKKYLEENKALQKTVSPVPQNASSLGKRSRGEDSHHESQTRAASFSPGWERGRGGRGRGRGRRGRRQDEGTPQQRRATLLEMLLAPDIRHERNVLLQCVRYIVRNNFFGLEAKASDQKRKKAQTLGCTAQESQQTQEMTSDQTMKSTGPAVCGQEVKLDQNNQEPKPLSHGPSDPVTVCSTRNSVGSNPAEARGVPHTAEAEKDHGLIPKAGKAMLHRCLLGEDAAQSNIEGERILSPAGKDNRSSHVDAGDVDALLPKGLEHIALPPAPVYDDEIWEIPSEKEDALGEIKDVSSNL